MGRGTTWIAGFLASLALGAAHADVTTFFDRGEWDAAVGPVITLDFTGFPDGTFITDQYAHLGALFTDGNDSIFVNPTFVNDGVGLDGNGPISVTFDTPQLWVAVDFPGGILFQLFSSGDLIYESPLYGVGGKGFFVGLLSSHPFDSVILSVPASHAAIDDLHFGVPGGPTLALFALALLRSPRRRQWSAS